MSAPVCPSVVVPRASVCALACCRCCTARPVLTAGAMHPDTSAVHAGQKPSARCWKAFLQGAQNSF